MILYFIENQDNKTDAIICSKVKKVSPYTYTIKHSYYDTEQYSWVIKPKYEDIDGSGEFSENLITVKNSDYLWGFINKLGKIVIPIKYTSVGYFSDGLAKVRVGDNTGNKGTWGFIDKEGKFKVSPQFSKVKDYRNGVIAVRYGAEWGIIKL